MLEIIGKACIGAANGALVAWRRFVSIARQPRAEALSIRGCGVVGALGGELSRFAAGPTDVVFVGYGIEAPEYDWNDFKGRDLTGK